jgi:hemerythrin-like domain-containing protein
MFGIRKLLSKNSDLDTQVAPQPMSLVQPVEPVKSGPNGYDPTLVAKLKDDHQGLVKNFTAMIKSAEKGNDKHTLAYMSRFKKLLQHHLITENTKLYLYLNTVFRQDADTFDIVKGFRQEMGQIGRVVNAFVEKWERSTFDEVKRGNFIKEANKIAGVLVQRISTEEDRLYEIYDFSITLSEKQ